MAYGTRPTGELKPTKALLRLRAIGHQLYALLLSELRTS